MFFGNIAKANVDVGKRSGYSRSIILFWEIFNFSIDNATMQSVGVFFQVYKLYRLGKIQESLL